MKSEERKLYQKNRAGYFLIILFIAMTSVHAIYTLNNMPVDFNIGIFVMITITILLLGFLTAVKVQNYLIPWCYVAIGLGVFQTLRLFIEDNSITGKLNMVLIIIIILSSIVCISGGIMSLITSTKRQKYIDEHEDNNEHLVH